MQFHRYSPIYSAYTKYFKQAYGQVPTGYEDIEAKHEKATV